MSAFEIARKELEATPVHPIIRDVVGNVLDHKVTVLAAPTGSGKTMLLPGALADATDDQVLVLVPRRLLAIDAACNVAQLSKTRLGKEVGFAIGQMNGDKSQWGPNTKVVYATYGYALRSGLINTARTVVLDEVHEGDEHISLARAVLHKRKKTDQDLRILEMSATVNANAQAAFWNDIGDTAIHESGGEAPACKFVHEVPPKKEDWGKASTDRCIEDVVMDLLDGKNGYNEQSFGLHNGDNFAELMAQSDGQTRSPGRKGIALFRGGINEVERSVAKLKQMLQQRGITDVEVVGIHGNTPSDQRREARLPPAPGHRKIIVGTNVVESGVNLLWLDAGVSDGVRKVPHDRTDTGASVLLPQSLPQSGITQQKGRINRNPKETGFAEGIFILYAKEGLEKRAQENSRAIERQSMLAPAFHAACLGHDPSILKWDVSHHHQADCTARLEQARQELVRLELIHEDWSLTEGGEFIKNLPVSPEMGGVLNEAARLDTQRLHSGKPARVLRDAVIIAAISEAKNLKLDSKKSFGGDPNGGSDILDAMTAYQRVVGQARRRGVFESVLEKSDENYLAEASEEDLAAFKIEREQLEELCARENMTLHGFLHVTQLTAEINHRLYERKSIKTPVPAHDEEYNAERYNELKRCLLNGGVNRLFQFEHGGMRDLLRDYGNRKANNGKPFNGYEIAESSMVNGRHPTGTLVTGELREVIAKKPKQPESDKQGKKKKKEKASTEPLLVVSNATVIPPEVFIAWANDRAAREQSAANPNLAVTEGYLSGNGKLHGKLHGKYAGKAEFELPLTTRAARLDAESLCGSAVEHTQGGEWRGKEYHRRGRHNQARAAHMGL